MWVRRSRVDLARARQARTPGAWRRAMLLSALALALLPVAVLAPSRARAQGTPSPAPSPAAKPDTTLAAAPQPPAGLDWHDVANDAGRSIDLNWKISPDDRAGSPTVVQYVIERSESPGGPWAGVDSVAAGTTSRIDQSVSRDVSYFYRIVAVGPGGRTPALSVTGPAIATAQWFNQTRWSVLLFTIA